MKAFVANGPAYTFLDRYQKKTGFELGTLSFWELVDGGPPEKTVGS